MLYENKKTYGKKNWLTIWSIIRQLDIFEQDCNYFYSVYLGIKNDEVQGENE